MRGDPPSRAGPRSPCPFGRSHLSVGEAALAEDLGSWAGPGPPLVTLEALQGHVRELHAALRTFSAQQRERSRRGGVEAEADNELVDEAARNAGGLTAAVAQLRDEGLAKRGRCRTVVTRRGALERVRVEADLHGEPPHRICARIEAHHHCVKAHAREGEAAQRALRNDLRFAAQSEARCGPRWRRSTLLRLRRSSCAAATTTNRVERLDAPNEVREKRDEVL